MKLSNSIKLLMANFSLFWKVLLYKIFALGVVVLLFLPILNIVNLCLTNAGFYASLDIFMKASVFQNPSLALGNLFLCYKDIVSALGLLWQASVVSHIYLILLVFVIAPFIFKLSDVPTSETVYSYMSSLSRNSFTVNFVDAFPRSAGYSILKTLIQIPFWVVILYGTYGILSLTEINLGMQILCPFLLFVFIVLMADLKITALSGWTSSIVVFNICAGKALKKGIGAVRRKFLSVLSSFAVVSTVMVAVLYIFGIYSLIIIVPLASILVAVFGQVLYFESQGMNYYVTPDKIVMPRKLEQADSIKKVKNII